MTGGYGKGGLGPPFLRLAEIERQGRGEDVIRAKVIALINRNFDEEAEIEQKAKAEAEKLVRTGAPGVRRDELDLRKVELLRPRTVIAKNTVEALQSGLIFGFASQVDGIVTRMVAELKQELSSVNVIATGGLAPVVVDEATVITDHQPWLTLLGLEIVFGRNSALP